MRIGYNENGHAFSAEVPARDKRELAVNVTYLSRIEQSMEVEKISESSFHDKCRLF